MTSKEKAALLSAWQINIGTVTDTYITPIVQLGLPSDSPLFSPLLEMMEDYTSAVSAHVGDTDEWLGWFWSDCALGAEPKEVKFEDGTSLVVSDIPSLLSVLAFLSLEPSPA